MRYLTNPYSEVVKEPELQKEQRQYIGSCRDQTPSGGEKGVQNWSCPLPGM